ncbi:hypothetical protein G8C42_14120 [Citrobacter freundii]|uniref:hypothetical protein n=1 Tax=Citrobacter freundii TaxID=546 RepID=UPI00188465B4|nr:hypothetical protein [Citrobacter freundii]MBE9967563.1 hypothetical protein [Citrobacter freundii]MBE9977807.1 hypothetical protein [Citrobacter freundii]MBE9987481.1 hypothetical protein [Citrobacter freundii]MBF0066850.1 hypothetical protein [Citrobacter freundii]
MIIGKRNIRADYQSMMLSALFFVLFAIDAISKYYRHAYDYTPDIIPRVLFLLVCILIIMTKINIKTMTVVFACLFMTLFFSIGAVLNKNIINSDLFDSFFLLFKYIAGLLVMYVCYTCKNKRIISNAFFYIFIINCMAAIASLLLNVQWMRTYGHIRDASGNLVDLRFGYNGFILEQNISTFFYIAGIYCTYYQVKYLGKSPLYLMLAVFACVIIGTKAIAISFLMIPVFILFKSNNVKLAAIIFTTIILIYILLSTNVITYDMANSILSFRPYNFVNRLYPLLSNYDAFTLLFGFQIPDFNKYLTEFEIIDMISFFGVIVTITYIILFFYLCSLFVNSVKTKELAFNYIITIFIVSSLTGHLFYDPISMIYTSFGLASITIAGIKS